MGFQPLGCSRGTFYSHPVKQIVSHRNNADLQVLAAFGRKCAYNFQYGECLTFGESGLNRYCYPTYPARQRNGVVNHSLSKLRDSVRGPVLSPSRSYASTLVKGLISPNLPKAYASKQETLNFSFRFISVQAMVSILAANLILILSLIPRSFSLPLSSLE